MVRPLTFCFLLIASCVAHRRPAWRAALPFAADASPDAATLVQKGRDALWQGALTRDDPKRAAELFDRATTFAERALATRNPALAAAARARQPPAARFALASPADAPALALYAESLLAWSLARGTPTVIDRRVVIAAAAGRALTFDPRAGFGAPDRVLAILECALPEAGQNLRDALDHFESALAAAPLYLPTRVAYAEHYARRLRDGDLYRRLLQAVLDADPDALPAAAPANRAAQKVARRLLEGGG